MSTPRVDALRAWQAALQLMTGTRPWGGSYQNDPTVVLAWKRSQQVNAYPHLCLYPASGSRVGPGTQEKYADYFVAVVSGYVQGTATVPLVEMVQHLIRDCKVALLRTSQDDRLILPSAFEENPEQIEFSEDGRTAYFDLPFTAYLEDALT